MSCLQGEGSSPIQVWRRLFTLAHPGTRAHLAPPCIRTLQTSKLNNTIPHHNTSHKDAHFNTTNHQAHTPDKRSAYLGVSEHANSSSHTPAHATHESHDMAPTRTRKRKSDMSSSATSSPIKKQRKMGLSILQKQALIDNLQLERMS